MSNFFPGFLHRAYLPNLQAGHRDRGIEYRDSVVGQNFTCLLPLLILKFLF